MAQKKISALVLVDGTAEELTAVHRELRTRLQEMGSDFEYLYLIGTSDRETLRAAEELRRQEEQRFRIFQFALPVSQSAMLSAGADHAEGDVLLTIPGSPEVDLAVLPELVAALEQADLAVACRVKGASAVSSLHSRLFNRTVSWATGSHYSDIASRTRALRPRVLADIDLYGDFHRYVPLLAERVGFRVVEVEATEAAAPSHGFRSPLSYLWRGIDLLSVLFISRFTRYPLRLFGGVGTVFAALGALIVGVIGVQRLLGTPAADRPLLVLGVLLLGLGVQGFAIGLLGELLLYFHSRGTRDYRILAVHESDPPPLPERQD